MIEIQGVDQLERLAKNLRDAADKGLEKELSKALSAVTRPIVRDIKQSARDNLPRRGGLNRKVAASRFGISRTQRGLWPGR